MSNSNNQTIRSGYPKFTKGNLKVSEVARVLRVDSQTVRLMLQQGLVSWGCAYKRTPKSRQFSYLISPKRFFEETGVILGGVEDDR